MKLESLVLELFADTSRLDREVKAAVDKAANQIKKLEQGALSVKVNEKPLHDLNRLLDVKQAHIKQTAEVFSNTLLAVRVDDSQVSDANSELKSLKNELRGIQDKTINVKVSQSVTADLKTANNDTVSAIKDLGKGLKDIVSAVRSANKIGIGGMVGGLLKTALTVPFNIAEGALEGFGRDLTSQIASGFTDEIDTALSQKFGSPKAIGIVAGKSIVGRVQNTIDGVDKWIDDQIDAEIKQQGSKKKKTQKRESLEFIRSVLDDIGTFVDGYVPDEIKTEQGRVSDYERESSKAKTKAKAKKGLVNQAESQSRVLTAFESALAIENQFTEPIGKYKKMAAVVNQRIAAAELRNQEINILMESAQKKEDHPTIQKLREEYARNEKTIIDSGNEAELINNQLKPILASKSQSISSVTSGLDSQELAQLNKMLSAYGSVTSSSGNIGQLEKQLEQLEQAKVQNKAKYRDGNAPNLDVADRIDLLIDNAILVVEKQIQSIKESVESEQRKLDAVFNGYNSSRLEMAGMDEGFSIENSKKALSLSSQRAAKAKANAAQFQAKLESLRSQRDQLSANIDKEELEKESKRNLLEKKKSRIDGDIWLNEYEKQSQKQSIDSEILSLNQSPSMYNKSALSDIDKRIADIESKFQLAQKVVLSEQSIIQSLKDKIKKNSLAVYNVVTLLSELSGQKMSIEDAPEIVVADEALKQRKANAVYDVAANVVMVSKAAFDLLQSADLEKKENAKVLQVLAHELTHALDLDMGSDYGRGASFAGKLTRQRPNITVGDYLGQGLGKFISPYKANSNFEQIRPLELNAEYLANQYISSKFDDVNFESPLPRLQGFSDQLKGQSSDLLGFLESQPTVVMPVERKGVEIKENTDSQGIEVYNQSKAKTNKRLNKETVIEYEQVSIVDDLIKKVRGLQSLQETIENNIGKLVALQSKDISGLSQDELDEIEASLKVQINNLGAVKNKINLLSKEVSDRVKSYSSYTQENTDIESLLDDAVNFQDLSKLQEARKRIANQIKSIKNDPSLDDKTKSVLLAQSKEVAKKTKLDTKLWDAPSMGDMISNPMESLQLVVDKSADRVVEVFTQVGDAISDAGERIRDTIESIKDHPLEALQAAGGVALDAGKGALSVANQAARRIAPAVSGGYGVMKGIEGAVLDVLPYGRLTKKAIQVGAVAGGIPLAAAAVPALAPVAGALGAVGHLGGGLAGSAVAGQLGAVGSIPIVGGQVASMITAGASGLGTVVTEMVVAATALNAAIKGAQIIVNKAIEPSTKETFKALAPAQETIRTRVESKTKKQITKLEQYAENPETILGQLLPSQRDLVAGYLPTLSDSVKSLRGDFVPQESEFKGLATLNKKQFAALPPELQDTVRKDAVNHYKQLNTILNELRAKFNSTTESTDRTQGAFPTLLSQVSRLVEKAEKAVRSVGVNPNEVVKKMTKEDKQSFTLDVDAVRMPDMKTLKRDASVDLSESGKNASESFGKGIDLEYAELAGESIGETADKGLKKSLKIESPSKVFIRHGKDTVIGFELGVNGEIKRIKDLEIPIPELEKQGYIDLAGVAESVDKMKEYKEIYDAVIDSWSTNLDVDNPESTAKVSDTVKPLIADLQSIQKQKARHAQVMANLPALPNVQSIDPNEPTRIVVPNVPDPKRGQWLNPNIYNNVQATSWVSGQVNDKNFLDSLDKETADLLRRLKQKSVKVDEAVSLIARDTWLSINETIINSQADSLESSQELIQSTLDKLKETLKVIDNLDIEEGTLLQNSQQKLDELVNFYGYTIPVSNLPEIGMTAGSDPFSVSIPELTPELLSEYDAVNQANRGLDATLANQAEDFTELLARVSGHIETLNNTIDIYDQSNILMDDGYDANQAIRIASNGNLPPVPPLPPILDGLRQQFPIIDQAINKFNDLRDTIVSFGTGAAKLLVFAFLGKQLADLGVEAINVYRRFEGIFIASRLVGDGAKYLEKVREQTKALGGDLESAMRSAIQFSTALVGTNLESTGQQLFLDSDKALKSLGLQTQEYDNAMRAIIQISSKGKVSMEELSGQLGEQVPGALQIAADAMQTNVKGLIQMVSSGNLLSEDFVPKFVQQLKNRTAFLAPAVEESLNTSIGRLGAQKEDLFVNIGAELSPAVIPLVNALSGALKGLTDNFDAVVFTAKTLGLYLASPAILGGLKLIATNAMSMFTSLITMMGRVQITAKTMWSAVAGPAKLAGLVGATAGIESLIYVMQGGAKTFKDANEELDRFMGGLGKMPELQKDKNFFDNQKEVLYDFYLRPFDEKKAIEELETFSGKLNFSIPLTTGRLDTASIDEYVEKASQLQAKIDGIKAQRDFLMMEDPVKNKDIISALESQLYNKDDGLIVKVQADLNNAFTPGGRAGLEEQIRILEGTIQKIKLTPEITDDGFLLDYQFKLDRLKSGLAMFDAAQERVSNNLNKQRLAWIELTSSIAGYEYQLNRSITQAETQLYNLFNEKSIGTEMQSYLVAEFDVARQQAEVDKYTAFVEARTKYLKQSLSTDSQSLVEQITKKPILEIDAEGIDRIENMIQGNDSIKNIITEQVLSQLKGLSQDADSLDKANLELAKGKNSLRQARITEQEYKINLSRSIFDFNKDLEVQLFNIQNQFRDYNRQLEDAAINSAKMVRGLIESYQDLNYDLENNILTVQNEILDAQERLKLTNLKIQSEQFDPGQDTIAKRAGSIILRLFESINSGESEKRRRLQEANQAQKEYNDTLRRIRDFEEQVLQERLNQKRQIEDLTNGFKNLNQAVKDLVEQLNRSREDLIRNTKNQSGRDISGQLNSVPNQAQMGAILPPPPPPIQGAIYAPLPTQQVALPPSQQLNPVQAIARPNPNESPTIRYGAAVVPQVRQVPTTLEELTRQNGGNFQDFSGNTYQTTPRQNTRPAPQIQSVAPVKIDFSSIPEIQVRLVAAEARNQSLVEQALVSRSLENRQRVNKPGVYLARSNSIPDLINAPNQYEPVRSTINNINAPRTRKELETAYQAILLGRDTERLRAQLIKEGRSQSEIRQLLNATGFRTPSAKNDNSQNFNRVRYGGHIFNSDQYGRQRLQSSLNFGVTRFENVRGTFAQSSGQLDVTQSPLEWLKKDLQRTLEPITNLFNKLNQKGDINPAPVIKLQQEITPVPLQNPSGIYSPKVEPKPEPAKVTPPPKLTPYPKIEATPYPDIKPQRVAPFKGFEFKPNYNPLVVPLPEIKATPDMVQPDFGRVVTPIPSFDTQTLKDRAADIKALKDAFTQLSLANIDADKKLAGLTAISEMSQLVMTTQDSIRQMNFSLVASADTVERMRKDSKGYLTITEEINNVVLDTARNYDNEINSRRESAIQLEREVGSYKDQFTMYKEALQNRKDIGQAEKEILINKMRELEVLMQSKTGQAEILKGEAQRLENNRQIAIYNKQIREEQQRQMALAKELSDAQLSLANARYEMGGSLFNTGVIKAAREDAIQIEFNADRKAESWNGSVDPQEIQRYVDGQRELAQINIAQSYLDAIPALRDFSSGLKDIILMTSTWQEVTKKLIDTLAGLVLDTLVIKPMQNWLAQGVAGMMGWMGDSTAPTNLNPSNRKPDESLGNAFIDTTNALGLFNQNLLQSNTVIPDFTSSLLSLFTGSAQDNEGGFGDIIGTGASLITGIGNIFGFAHGTDEVENIMNFAKGTDNLDILTLAKGTDLLDDAIPSFANGADSANIDLMMLAKGDDSIGEIINLAKGQDDLLEVKTLAKGLDELNVLSLAKGKDEIKYDILSLANGLNGDENIVNFAKGVDDLDIDLSTFARGSIKVEVPNFAIGSIEKAFKKERLESGGKTPFLAVLHKGEAVLSTLNRDAQFYRHLKATGQWDHLKAGPRVENYAYGTVENIVSRPQAQIKEPARTTIYRPEYNIYAQDADSFRKSQRQIEQESMSRMRRRPR